MATTFAGPDEKTSFVAGDFLNGYQSPGSSGDDRRWGAATIAKGFAGAIGNNMNGSNSAGFGANAGLANTTGESNVFFGESAGTATTSGGFNVFVGRLSGSKNTTGARNIFIGYGAGEDESDGITALTDAQKSIYIGYQVRGSSSTAEEEIAIGYAARAKGSNSATIGGTAQTEAYIYGNLITSDDYTGTESNFIGRLAGDTSAADYAVGVGHGSHYQTTASADRATGLGAYSFYQSGSYGGVAAGYRAGDSSNGDYSIYIGYEAGLNDLWDNVICVGKGVTADGSNEAWWGPATITKHVFQGGNVGLGGTPGSFKVDILGDAAAATGISEALRLRQSSDGGVRVTLANSIGSLAYLDAGVESAGAGTDDGYLAFHTALNGALSEAMRITSTGDVYIGASADGRVLSPTEFGYAAAYKVLQIGATSGFSTVAIGYDPSGNATSAFQGDGREVLFRNGVEFTTPNSGDTAFHRYALTLKDGQVGMATPSPTAPLDINGASIRLRSPTTPASASATGNQGTIYWDTNYIYVCVGSDTWKRAALSTW